MPSAEPPAGEPDYRFTLANERTLLAYERTAIALVAAALAVLHLLDKGWPTTVLGVALIAAGAVASGAGYARFRAVERALRAGSALPTNRGLHVLAAAVVACVLAALLTVFF